MTNKERLEFLRRAGGRLITWIEAESERWAYDEFPCTLFRTELKYVHRDMVLSLRRREVAA